MKRNKNTLAKRKRPGSEPTRRKYDDQGRKISRGASSPFNPNKQQYHAANQVNKGDKARDMTHFCPVCSEIVFNNVVITRGRSLNLAICPNCGKELKV